MSYATPIRAPWADWETNLLRVLMFRFGLNHKRIARYLPDRTPQAIRVKAQYHGWRFRGTSRVTNCESDRSRAAVETEGLDLKDESAVRESAFAKLNSKDSNDG